MWVKVRWGLTPQHTYLHLPPHLNTLPLLLHTLFPHIFSYLPPHHNTFLYLPPSFLTSPHIFPHLPPPQYTSPLSLSHFYTPPTPLPTFFLTSPHSTPTHFPTPPHSPQTLSHIYLHTYPHLSPTSSFHENVAKLPCDDVTLINLLEKRDKIFYDNREFKALFLCRQYKISMYENVAKLSCGKFSGNPLNYF